MYIMYIMYIIYIITNVGSTFNQIFIFSKYCFIS